MRLYTHTHTHGIQFVRKIVSLTLIIVYLISAISVSFANTTSALSNDLMKTSITEDAGIFACADNSTVDDYKNIEANLEQGGRYDGRIWTDKSVYAHNENPEVTLDGKFNINYNEDFLHVFSVLGSSKRLVALPPAKTIIVIDNSGSMYSATEFEKNRAYKTAMAVNEAIDTLMRAGAYNEVGVVGFGLGGKSVGNIQNGESTAEIIMPIGHYPISDNKENPYQYLKVGWGLNNTESGESIIPEEPVQDATNPLVNRDSGWIYVDKVYVNNNFEVDNTLTNKTGLERYDMYSNGTTNIQAGFYEGFKALLESDKYVKVDGNKFNFVPSMAFLTDGNATDMLKGVFSNPVNDKDQMEAVGYTNDRGDKMSAFDREYSSNNDGKYTFFWNMLMKTEIINGVETLKEVGYGDGTLSPGHSSNGAYQENANPGIEGRDELRDFAGQFRSTQGSLMLSTLMTAGYMKAAVEKEYDEKCKVYTISVDMPDPANIEVPEQVVNSSKYQITTNQTMMNPKLFTKEYLKEKGYVRTENLNNIGEEDTAYEPYTVGSEIILGIVDAVNAWNEWKNNKNSVVERNKLYIYLPHKEVKGLYDQMETGSVDYMYDGEHKQFPAIPPIGPDHSNAYFFDKEYTDITFPNLIKGDKVNNPYDLSDRDVDVNYVTEAYYVSTSLEALNSIDFIFSQVIDSILEPPFMPVGDMENEAGIAGVLSYVDPIGKYMEIKSVDKLLLFGNEYNIIKDGDIKTETVEGQTVQKQYYKAVGENGQDLTIENTAYGKNITFNLSEIKIWREISNNYDTGEGREIDTSFDEALHVTIPKNAIPIMLDSIKYDRTGRIIEYTENTGTDESLPLRIIYEVGISEDIINDKGMIDLSRLSQEYFSEHKKTINGKDCIEFLSNYYSQENYDKIVNNTFGNAAVTFMPSEENRFYIFQKNLVIYENSTGGDINGEGELVETGGAVKLTGEVKNLSEIKKDKTYYFGIDYYAPYNGADGSKGRLVRYAVAYKGSDFYGKNDECYLTLYDKEAEKEVETANENTVVATKVGGRRTSRIERLAVNKTNNRTETSTMVSAPRYGGPLSEDSIVDYLGNNGRLAVSATWLFVNKVVNANVDKNHFYEPTNEEFEFELYLDKNIGTENAIVYGVYSWNGETWIPKKDKNYVITDNEGYILFSDGTSSTYWVGNTEDERFVNEDGTITVYDNKNKTGEKVIKIFTDENQLESLYKITSTMKTKKLNFTQENREIKTTFKLKDGEGLLLSGLLPETKWRVTENLTQDQLDRNFAFESITGREGDEVTITERTISGKTEAGLTDEANYRNNFTQYFKNLTIEKNVPGRRGDKEKEWEFEVKLTPKEDVILYDEYEYEGGSFVEGVEKAADGKITLSKNEDGTSSGKIKLKHGQNITIKDLPEGTSYEVIETEANLDDYITTSTNEKGVLDKDQTARYDNLKRTIELEFTKVKNENIEEPIEGTKFRLYRLICKDETHKEEHNKIIDINNLGTCWELYDEIISDENGKVKLKDLLPKEEYRLVEVEAAKDRIKPDGQWKIVYNSYEEEAEITAIAGKKMPPAFIKQENGELLLPNMAIYEIPLSGSTGTKIFTQIGIGMITTGLSLIYFGNYKKRKEE